jgi:BolA protein
MSVEQEMIARLTEALAPEVLEVRNDSAKHAGHAGDDGSGESHFSLVIRAAALDGKSRVAQHRAIHAALGKEMMARIHALAISVQS